ncbi:hypothetical protein [Amycolatopsis coloradensis]|uniref:hypothetical protein n=1 Tax=Amycolatopsis coloradensis TaxID=76021 RepID=UPI00244A865F|nr:hypothetical protein [Amycolatopsis coloradensis]
MESTGEFGSSGPAAIPGLPAGVAEQAQRLALEAVHHGLTDAARVTLPLPATVLLLGVPAGLTRRRPPPRPPDSRRPCLSPRAQARAVASRAKAAMMTATRT